MLKDKQLHRRTRNTKLDRSWDIRKYHRGKNVNLYSELPMHTPIRKQQWSSYYGDFDITPLREFIYSKIGECWDDVYSEIIAKTKKKYRYHVDQYLFNSYGYIIFFHPFYDDDFIPRDNRGRMLDDKIYIDENRILVKKSKQEILIESKQLIRRIKLLEIIENQEKEEENQELSS